MKKTLFLIAAALWLVASPLQAIHQPQSDSASKLLTALRETARDTTRVKLLNEIGNYYFSKHVWYDRTDVALDSAIYYFTRSVNLSDSLNLSQYQQSNFLGLGNAYLEKGQVEEGEQWFRKVIIYYQSNLDKEGEADTWAMLGTNMPQGDDNYQKAVTILQNAIVLYKELGQTKKETDLRTHLADRYYVAGKLHNAEEELLIALEKYQSIGFKNTENTYYLLSGVNRYKGDFNRALFYARKCVEVMLETDNTKSADYFYGELALVYDALGNPEESVHYYRLCLEVRERAPTDKLVIYRTANLLGHQLIKMQKGKEALALILSLRKKYPPVLDWEKACLDQGLGHCYNVLGDVGQAEKHFLKMIDEYERGRTIDEYIYIAYQDIGEFYLQRHNYAKAKAYLDKAIAAPQVERKQDIHLMLFQADSAMGNYISAIHHFRFHKSISDFIFNEKKSKQIEELQIQYKTAENEKQIMLLGNQNKIQQSQFQQDAMMRNFLITGAFLLIAFISYRYYEKQKINKTLEAQKTEINLKNASLQHLLKEKEWLMKEIHHRVKNNFHIVIGLLGTQSQYLKNAEAIDAFQHSQNRIHAMSMIHQKLYQSDNMSAINMPSYIFELVAYLQTCFETGQRIRFDLSIDRIELDCTHSLPIGLILNEAITNSIKYAFPGNQDGTISISLKQYPDNMLILAIADDGIGIPIDLDLTNPMSMGINLMRGLAEDIDGEFRLKNSAGTSIVISIMYDPELANEFTSTTLNQTATL